MEIITRFENDLCRFMDLGTSLREAFAGVKTLLLKETLSAVCEEYNLPTEEVLERYTDFVPEKAEGPSPKNHVAVPERTTLPAARCKCAAPTKKGDACRYYALNGSRFCKTHASFENPIEPPCSCKAMTKKGSLCVSRAMQGSDFCKRHQSSSLVCEAVPAHKEASFPPSPSEGECTVTGGFSLLEAYSSDGDEDDIVGLLAGSQVSLGSQGYREALVEEDPMNNLSPLRPTRKRTKRSLRSKQEVVEILTLEKPEEMQEDAEVGLQEEDPEEIDMGDECESDHEDEGEEEEDSSDSDDEEQYQSRFEESSRRLREARIQHLHAKECRSVKMVTPKEVALLNMGMRLY